MARVISRFSVDEATGCWITSYSSGSHGYGQVGWVDDGCRAMRLTHRVAFEFYCGPIPEGMTIDHICRNRRCLNPNHLRLLSNAENGGDNGNARKVACKRGHPFDVGNTYRDTKGHRRCRACARGEF